MVAELFSWSSWGAFESRYQLLLDSEMRFRQCQKIECRIRRIEDLFGRLLEFRGGNFLRPWLIFDANSKIYLGERRLFFDGSVLGSVSAATLWLVAIPIDFAVNSTFLLTIWDDGVHQTRRLILEQTVNKASSLPLSHRFGWWIGPLMYYNLWRVAVNLFDLAVHFRLQHSDQILLLVYSWIVFGAHGIVKWSVQFWYDFASRSLRCFQIWVADNNPIAIKLLVIFAYAFLVRANADFTREILLWRVIWHQVDVVFRGIILIGGLRHRWGT